METQGKNRFFPLQGNIYHGHVVSWKGLNEQVKKALEKAGLVNSHGKFWLGEECSL